MSIIRTTSPAPVYSKLNIKPDQAKPLFGSATHDEAQETYNRLKDEYARTKDAKIGGKAGSLLRALQKKASDRTLSEKLKKVPQRFRIHQPTDSSERLMTNTQGNPVAGVHAPSENPFANFSVPVTPSGKSTFSIRNTENYARGRSESEQSFLRRRRDSINEKQKDLNVKASRADIAKPLGHGVTKSRQESHVEEGSSFSYIRPRTPTDPQDIQIKHGKPRYKTVLPDGTELDLGRTARNGVLEITNAPRGEIWPKDLKTKLGYQRTPSNLKLEINESLKRTTPPTSLRVHTTASGYFKLAK